MGVIEARPSKVGYLPIRKEGMRCGYFLFAPRDFSVAPHSSATIDVGVAFSVPPPFALLAVGLGNGPCSVYAGRVVPSYKNNLLVSLRNETADAARFKRGDAFAMLVVAVNEFPQIVLDEGAARRRETIRNERMAEATGSWVGEEECGEQVVSPAHDAPLVEPALRFSSSSDRQLMASRRRDVVVTAEPASTDDAFLVRPAGE